LNKPAVSGATPKQLPKVTQRYYGWVIALVMGTAGAVSMGMCLFNFGLFIKPMGDELGLSRATFGWAQSLRQVAGAVSSPVLGRLVDRFGSRFLLPASVVLTGAAMIGMSYAQTELHLLLALSVIGIAGYAIPGGILTNVPVMKWFEHDRGRAMGLVSACSLIGGMVFLPFTQELIDRVGWRNAWFSLACLGVAVVVPLALIFVRRQPEDFGLLPDGATAAEAADANLNDDQHYTAKQAMRTRSFWVLALIFTLMSISIASIGLHRIPAFMDRGLSPAWVAWAMALDSVLAGVASVATGLLANRVGIRRIGALGFGLLATACYLTIIAQDLWLMALSMSVFGLGIGTVMQMQNLIWPAFFGRTHVGSIRGVVMPVTLVVSALSAPFAGYVYDTTGSYTSVWWAAVVLMSLGGLLSLSLRRPPAQPKAQFS